MDSKSSCFQRFSPPSQKPDRTYKDKSKELIKVSQDLRWNHVISTPHCSETNGVAERAVRRVKERTAVAFMHSGLPKEWRECAVECSCYLRDVNDKMPDGKTAVEKRYGQEFMDHQFHLEYCLSTSQVPRKTSPEYISVDIRR